MAAGKLTAIWILLLSLTFFGGATLVGGGCGKVTHESIDEWGSTAEGPAKLLEALKSDEHSAQLRSHAAEVLVEVDRGKDVLEILADLSAEKRDPILDDFATRLWDLARIDEDLALPSGRQSKAKDILYSLGELASGPIKVKIEGYLVEWYTGGHYDARANSGAYPGHLVMRSLGPAAAKRLLANANKIVSTPPGPDGKLPRVGDELLKGLAATGDPEVLGFLLDLQAEPRGDITLPKRISSALHFAFVEPQGMDPVDGKKLLPVLERIKELPYDRSLSGTLRNDAIGLLSAVGSPECIPIFISMIHKPVSSGNFLWIGIQQGARCAGADGWQPIVEAIPTGQGYEREMLEKYLWMEVLKYENKQALAKTAASLLNSSHWVARASGLEILRILGEGHQVFGNIGKIKELSSDTEALRGWAGEEKGDAGLPSTVGELALDVAKSLEGLASKGSAK